VDLIIQSKKQKTEEGDRKKFESGTSAFRVGRGQTRRRTISNAYQRAHKPDRKEEGTQNFGVAPIDVKYEIS